MVSGHKRLRTGSLGLWDSGLAEAGGLGCQVRHCPHLSGWIGGMWRLSRDTW